MQEFENKLNLKNNLKGHYVTWLLAKFNCVSNSHSHTGCGRGFWSHKCKFVIQRLTLWLPPSNSGVQKSIIFGYVYTQFTQSSRRLILNEFNKNVVTSTPVYTCWYSFLNPDDIIFSIWTFFVEKKTKKSDFTHVAYFEYWMTNE